MIYSLRGTVVHTEPNMIVVECGGVGYQCSTTNQTIAKLPKEQKQVLIYTYLQVREDAVNLFGFYDLNELSCFKMLISVSGVGPKAALAILSDCTPEKFALCVASGDYKTLTRSQGIGPKIAQRILRDQSVSIWTPLMFQRPSALWWCWVTASRKQQQRWPNWTALCRWRN